jgi:hypothetical protein
MEQGTSGVLAGTGSSNGCASNIGRVLQFSFFDFGEGLDFTVFGNIW